MSSQPRANILIVDDRPENLLALEAILEPLNQNLVRATSGEEALKRLLKDDFHLILLDVQMPGLNGFETATQIKQREKTRDVPIIFLTAISREPHHALQGYSTGAVDYISKPFDPFILRAKVSLFIEIFEKNAMLKHQRELLAQKLEELEKEIVQRKLAQEALQERKAVIQLLQQVAVAANEASSIDEAFLTAIDKVCEFAGGCIGRGLVLDEVGGLSTSTWSDTQDKKLEQFAKLVDDAPTSLLPLTQVVLRDGKPAWGRLKLAELEPRLKDAATQAGIRSWFSLPVRVGADVCGVLEFFSTKQMAEEDLLLEVADPVGSQVGRVVERARIDSELRRLDAAKSEFIANAAHELRTPLAIIAGIPDALIQFHEKISKGELVESLQTIQRQGERMRDLTNNLLDISRIDFGNFKVELANVELRPLVEHVLSVAPSPDGREVEVDIPDGLQVLADSALLDQVITNLITNSYKYGDGEIRVAAARLDEGVVVTISDEGPGVSETFVPHLFEPFARGRAPSNITGSGLGLAITRRIAQSLGGDVWYEANEPQGASFKVRLAVPN